MEKIKSNAEKIVLFVSRNDPYIPIFEALFIKDKFEPEYHEYSDEGHFGSDINKTEFPEIITVVKKFVGRQRVKSVMILLAG